MTEPPPPPSPPTPPLASQNQINNPATPNNNNNNTSPQIPIDIVSDEEMALIEAALAAAHSSFSSPTQFQQNSRSIQSITLLSKRRLSTEEPSSPGDIEDVAGCGSGSKTQKRNRLVDSLLHRFRSKRGLSVTDLTSPEWCEMQKEYYLLFGRPEISKAMKAGIARHTVLEDKASPQTNATKIWEQESHGVGKKCKTPFYSVIHNSKASMA